LLARQLVIGFIAEAEAKVGSCAEAACHGTSRMPRQLATALLPAIDHLRTEGRLILEEGRGSGGARAAVVRPFGRAES
jgi:hypothetical protein